MRFGLRILYDSDYISSREATVSFQRGHPAVGHVVEFRFNVWVGLELLSRLDVYSSGPRYWLRPFLEGFGVM